MHLGVLKVKIGGAIVRGVFVPVGDLVRDLGTGLAQAPLGVTTVGECPGTKNICYICMQHICNKKYIYVFAGHLALLVNHVIQKEPM